MGKSCEIFNSHCQSWLHSRIAFGGRGQVRGVLGYFKKKKKVPGLHLQRSDFIELRPTGLEERALWV